MNRYMKIALLGSGHLLVDFSSVYLITLYSQSTIQNIALYYIVYNLIAFALQPVFGFIADKYNYYRLYLYIGLTLPLIVLIIPYQHLLFIILATIGNALYHVGGGVISLRLFPQKALPAGIFVAPGAIGVFLGLLFGLNNYSILTIIIPTILVILTLYFVFGIEKEKEPNTNIPKNIGFLTFLILLIILIRGVIGFSLDFPWKGVNISGFILVLGVFTGKALGGILGDRFGYKVIGIAGLIISIPFLVFGYIPVLGMIGATLFNFTMAITLFLIISMYGKYQGFAFGLTTLALFISYIPEALGGYTLTGVYNNALLILLPLLAAFILNIVTNNFNPRREIT